MSTEAELRQALNILANNWCHDPQLREAFESIFRKLDTGTKNDKANAEILRDYLAYPGSEIAQLSSMSLHASLRTQQGRKAAGLKPKGRGSLYEPNLVNESDMLMQVMVAFELGNASLNQVEREAIAFLGVDAVDATRKLFLKKLRPRAIAYADFIRRFNSAYSEKEPL